MLNSWWVKLHLKDCNNLSPFDTFTPQSSNFKQEVSYTRVLTVGFDDIRLSDVKWLAPLFEKYGYKATFNKILYAKDSSFERRLLKRLLAHGHEIGCHTLLHEQYPFFSPLFNGQDPQKPDGSGQQPFPSNEDIRKERPYYSDEQCQQFRNKFSLLRDDELGTTLDLLSHYYLGTAGRSLGSWSQELRCYTRGIFTGCKTSENHEVWERIFEIQQFLLKGLKIGIDNFYTWSWPGSKNTWLMFKRGDLVCFDKEKPINNNARFLSSQSGKERSLTDILRSYGFNNTHDTLYPGRIDGQEEVEQRLQFIFNAWQSRKDALLYPTNRTIQYLHCKESFGLSKHSSWQAAYQEDKGNNNGIYAALENLRHTIASGIVAGCLWDTTFSIKEKKFWKIILDYCLKNAVHVIPKREAYDICFNQKRDNGNLIYNPFFQNSLEGFLPQNIINQNPDGWIGDCYRKIENKIPSLIIKRITYNKNYGLPYGVLEYRVEVKGKGSIVYSFIKNRTPLESSEEMEETFYVDNDGWRQLSFDINVKDLPMGDEKDRFEGMGDKIIGIDFLYQGELEIRNLLLVKK